MKRYTVKEVVKFEKQAERLNDLSRQRLDELYFLPLSFLSGIGLCLTMSYFKERCESVVPLILGASATISGITTQAYLSSINLMRGKLRDKISSIYDVMGADFKSNVENELLKQDYGYDPEQKGITR